MSHIKSKRTGKSTGRRKISRGKGFAGLEYLENRRVLATFTVTNLADGPVAASGDLPGSLRQAIYDANALSGSDDIVFDSQAAGFLPLTDGPLNIRDSVTITGPGPFDLTIGGGLQSRIFDINDLDFFNHSDVSISGMTLTAGSTGLEGGAIRTTESLEIRDVILAGNESLGAGGAIAVIEEIPVADAAMGLDAVELTIVDSSISGNTGADGGGVAVSVWKARMYGYAVDRGVRYTVSRPS